MKQVKNGYKSHQRAYQHYLDRHHKNSDYDSWARIKLEPEEYAKIQEQREWATLPTKGDRIPVSEGSIKRHNHDLHEDEWSGDTRLNLIAEEG